jgi:hypothetical protein
MTKQELEFAIDQWLRKKNLLFFHHENSNFFEVKHNGRSYLFEIGIGDQQRNAYDYHLLRRAMNESTTKYSAINTFADFLGAANEFFNLGK